MKKYTGFTLIEILVSLVILAIIGSMIVVGLQSAIRSQNIIITKSNRLAEVQSAIMILERDLYQIIDRSVISENGDLLPAVRFKNNRSSVSMEFTRAGFINPFGLQTRSTMQRVRYAWDGKSLFRSTWRVLDRAPHASTETQLLLPDVSAFTVRTMDKRGLLSLPDDTSILPAAQNQQQASLPLPIAIQVELVAEGVGN